MPTIKENSQDHFPDLLVLTLQTLGNNPFEELVEICRPITYGVTKRYYLPGYEKEDFLQEARAVLVSATQSWQKDKGMPFLQYYHMQLLNHLNMLVRKNHAQKRRINLETSSLDNLIEESGIQVQGRACRTTNPEEMLMLQEKLAHYKTDLSPLELQVHELHLKGQTYEEIAETLSITKAKVQNAFYRCRIKMEKAGE